MAFRTISVMLLSVLLLLGDAGCGDDGNPGLLPDSASILYLSNRDTGNERFEIYAMDASNETLKRITDSTNNHFIFGIDPQKKYLVMTRGSEAKKQLWLLNLQTGTDNQLTDPANNAEGRSFSPDGEWVVFWMVLSNESYADIYKIRRDGTGLTNLTQTPAAHEFDPCFSHDGNRIAYSYNDGAPNRFRLKVMDTDGGNDQMVYDPTNSVATAIFPPGVYDSSWSPDDTSIVVDSPVQFTGDGENGHAGIWHILKITVSSGDAVDLTDIGDQGTWANFLPSFSPDGTKIICSVRSGPVDPLLTKLRLAVFPSAGGAPVMLTDGTYWDQFPVWVP